MGFSLFTEAEAPSIHNKAGRVAKGAPSLALMHQLGCRLCPLAKSQCHSPDMAPRGPKNAAVYMLGSHPSRIDDEDGQHFSRDGGAGAMLHAYMPESDELELMAREGIELRWNYLVRTMADDQHQPTQVEIECCRKSIEADILATRPEAIFGFGDRVLQWFKPGMRLLDMRGRRTAVKIGDFTTWLYVLLDPAAVRVVPKDRKQADPQVEAAFKFDLRRAFRSLGDGDIPVVHSQDDALAGVETITRTHGGVQRVLELLAWAGQQSDVGFDYETNMLRPYRQDAKILSLGIHAPGHSFSFPLMHRHAAWDEQELGRIIDGIQTFLLQPTHKWVHNLAFELEWTGEMFGDNYIRTGTWEDSTTQAFLLDERTGNKQKNGPASLHFGCRLFFDFPIKDYSSVDRKAMADEPLDKILPYNAVDAKYHYLLGMEQRKLLMRQGLMGPYEKMVGRVPTVVLTQMKGIPIDAAANQQYFEHYTPLINAALDAIEASPHYKAFTARTNHYFNPASNADLTTMFRDVLGSEKGEQVDGSWKNDVDVLSKIRDPLAKSVLAFRAHSKAYSTYVLPLRPDSEHNYSGLLHTILNTVVARTGRLSSEAPNIQNFPTRDPEMGKMRRQVAAQVGRLIVKVDYGQIEARVIAMATRDPAFCKALWERYDVHMAWAEKIEKEVSKHTKSPLDKYRDPDKHGTLPKKMKAFRTDIKNQWTFPLFFGAKLDGISKFIGIDVKYLNDLHDEWWQLFAGVKRWQKQLKAEYDEHFEITYLTGRKARGPISDNQLYNYPIQGPTCDIVLDAMARVSARSVEDFNYQPIMNVHDDLTFDLPEAGFDTYMENIIDDMLAVPYDFVNVPITLEVSAGPNWHDQTSEGDYSTDTWKKAA